MPAKQLYEYAVIRVVPQVEREEFMNIGVLLYSRGMRYLNLRYGLDEARLNVFAPQLDPETVRGYLLSMEAICCGTKDSGPIGKLDTASRFRWLTATRSTVVQTSRVHPGFCTGEPAVILNDLFDKLVGMQVK